MGYCHDVYGVNIAIAPLLASSPDSDAHACTDKPPQLLLFILKEMFACVGMLPQWTALLRQRCGHHQVLWIPLLGMFASA